MKSALISYLQFYRIKITSELSLTTCSNEIDLNESCSTNNEYDSNDDSVDDSVKNLKEIETSSDISEMISEESSKLYNQVLVEEISSSSNSNSNSTQITSIESKNSATNEECVCLKETLNLNEKIPRVNSHAITKTNLRSTNKLIKDKPFNLQDAELLKGVQPGRLANVVKNKIDDCQLPLPNNYISFLNLILNLKVNISTDFKNKIAIKDFNSAFHFSQTSAINCESVIYKKTFKDLFLGESLTLLNERMNNFIDTTNFKCCNCDKGTDRSKKSVTCSKCFELFCFSCVKLTAKPKTAWCCSKC